MKKDLTTISRKLLNEWDLRKPSIGLHDAETLFCAYYHELDRPIRNRKGVTVYPKIVGALTTWDSFAEGLGHEERDRDGFELAIKRVPPARAPHPWTGGADYDYAHSELLF